jgi:hypothetical protein
MKEAAIKRISNQKAWFKIVSNPLFIAVLLGCITFLLLDLSPDKFIFDMARHRVKGEKSIFEKTYYYDLNGDGTQESLLLSERTEGNSLLVVLKSNGLILDQWNFKGEISEFASGLYISDFNHDNNAEIAVFTRSDREILINVIEPFGMQPSRFSDFLVDTISVTAERPDLFITDFKSFDLNSDGMEEYVFALHTAYAIQPRKVYSLNLTSGVVFKSPFCGFAPNQLTIFDFDKDGELEIISSNRAQNNYPDGGVPLPDTVTWFAPLTSQLEFKRTPVPTGTAFSKSQVIQVKAENDTAFIWVNNGGGVIDPSKCWFRIDENFNLDQMEPLITDSSFILGSLVESANGDAAALLAYTGETNYIISSSGEVYSFNLNHRNETVQIYNPNSGSPDVQFAFVDTDLMNKIELLDGLGRRIGKLNLDLSQSDWFICWSGKEEGKWRMFLSSRTDEFFFDMRTNPWRYLSYLLLLFLIGGFWVFIWLIRYFHSMQLAQKEGMKKEILELQLIASKGNLDPHFIFNALNTISGLSVMGENGMVDQIVVRFSRLLRIQLTNSDKILIPLREEIEFAQDFIELQNLRYGNSFGVSFNIDDEVDCGRLIPKYMIQTHIENAIKHGLRPAMALARDQGLSAPLPLGIKVDFQETVKGLIISIEDNGVGRGFDKASKYENTGKGLMSQEKINAIVYQLYSIDIKYNMEDLVSPEGQSVGTRVLINVNN